LVSQGPTATKASGHVAESLVYEVIIIYICKQYETQLIWKILRRILDTEDAQQQQQYKVH